MSVFTKTLEDIKRQKAILRFPEMGAQRVEAAWGGTFRVTLGKSAPGVEKNICNYLNAIGHQAEKISVMGREVRAKDVKTSLGTLVGKSTYIPSTSTKGSADISAVVYSLSFSIEVKLGNDKQSDAQKKYEQHVKRAGGFYFIAKDEDDFLIKFNELLEHPKVKLMKSYYDNNN